MTEPGKYHFDEIDRQHLEFFTDDGPVVVDLKISHSSQENIFQVEGKIKPGKKGDKQYRLILEGPVTRRTGSSGRENQFRFEKVPPGDYVLYVQEGNTNLEIGLSL